LRESFRDTNNCEFFLGLLVFYSVLNMIHLRWNERYLINWLHVLPFYSSMLPERPVRSSFSFVHSQRFVNARSDHLISLMPLIGTRVGPPLHGKHSSGTLQPKAHALRSAILDCDSYSLVNSNKPSVEKYAVATAMAAVSVHFVFCMQYEDAGIIAAA
jgi:hypothetical protein